MYKFHIVQAKYGDCLILEFGTATDPHFILIDGGPSSIYEDHLKGELLKIQARSGKLDLVVLSHPDGDHTIGLLDLFAELRQQRDNQDTETIAIDALWHNAFHISIDPEAEVQNRLDELQRSGAASNQAMSLMNMAINSIDQGNQLQIAARLLQIPINQGMPDSLISVEKVPDPVSFDNLKLRIFGPTEETLEDLRDEWLDWLAKQEAEEELYPDDPFMAAMTDRSVTNLSSITFLAKSDEKSLLLTGDGRGDHLLQGLEKAGMLDDYGGLHVDVFKIPHHGSARNVTRKFFKQITADCYVISADGRHGNPDLATLIWLVEAAKEQDRDIEIVVTNHTASIQKLLEEYPQDEFRYQIREMSADAHTYTLDLAP